MHVRMLNLIWGYTRCKIQHHNNGSDTLVGWRRVFIIEPSFEPHLLKVQILALRPTQVLTEKFLGLNVMQLRASGCLSVQTVSRWRVASDGIHFPMDFMPWTHNTWWRFASIFLSLDVMLFNHLLMAYILFWWVLSRSSPGDQWQKAGCAIDHTSHTWGSQSNTDH